MVKGVDIASYADDSTLFIVEINIDYVIASLNKFMLLCLIGSKVIV